MENRFGLRDFVLTVLLLAILVTLWLAIKQYDRQWEVLQQMQSTMATQTHDLARIRSQLASGIVAAPASDSGAGTASAGTARDPFQHVKVAQKKPGYTLGDYYVDVFAVVPDKLTPLISSDAYSSIIQSYILEGLAERDERTLEWRPNLATAWRISPDGLRIEFDLRQGITYSDGEPVTADDYVFTFNWIMNPEVEAPRARSYYEKIQKLEKLSDRTIAFTFREPYFDSFALAAGFSPLARHLYGKYSPQDFNRSTGLLLGTGLYRLPNPTSWKPEPGKPIELVRNERYWGEPAPFDKIIFRVIDNEAARLTTFRNGELDALYPTPEQYRAMLKDEELVKRSQHFEYNTPTAGYIYIGWNQNRGGKPTIFADKRVRQAMTMLIDRQRIVDEVFLGYANVATGPFNPLGKQADPNVKPWPYDPQRALAQLKDVGYADRNNDGVLESPQGEPLKFKLAYPATSETYKRAVLFMKDTFARAGVVLEPDPTEWSVLLKRLDDRDFEACSLGWTASLESDLYQIFHSSQITGTGDNNISYSNPEFDKLIEQARAEVNEAKRMPMWQQAHRILHEDQPYTFMIVRKSLIFIDGRVQNVERTKIGLNPLPEWFVPASKRRWVKGAAAASAP